MWRGFELELDTGRGLLTISGTGTMDDYSKYSNKAPWSSYQDAVAWAAGRGITLGTAPGYFAPFDFCSRAQIITFFWRAAGSPEPSSSGTPFTDVTDSSAYYYKPVLWAVETGLTNGVSETNFGTIKFAPAPRSSPSSGALPNLLPRKLNRIHSRM